MRLNPGEVVMPVLNFLDSLIRDYDDYLFMVFTWLAIPVIAWILSGGLRRNRSERNITTVVSRVIFTIHSPQPSSELPPIIGCEPDPIWCDDDICD
jgi:hypothetical protein